MLPWPIIKFKTKVIRKKTILNIKWSMKSKVGLPINKTNLRKAILSTRISSKSSVVTTLIKTNPRTGSSIKFKIIHPILMNWQLYQATKRMPSNISKKLTIKVITPTAISMPMTLHHPNTHTSTTPTTTAISTMKRPRSVNHPARRILLLHLTEIFLQPMWDGIEVVFRSNRLRTTISMWSAMVHILETMSQTNMQLAMVHHTLGTTSQANMQSAMVHRLGSTSRTNIIWPMMRVLHTMPTTIITMNNIHQSTRTVHQVPSPLKKKRAIPAGPVLLLPPTPPQ
mmetsp:Transcript_227/g.445  ORF Transcript_227/g.445 Transcript_227/m.445 type:complete len:283 (+) Transcript_227:3107-3955(+)